MKKLFIITGIALLAYSFKDKIFGTSTADATIGNVRGMNADGTPRLLTEVELTRYITAYPGLKSWFDANIPKGTDYRLWANNDWLTYNWQHNTDWS